MVDRHANATSASLNELPVLVARLGEDLMTLVESKLGLLKVEVAEEVTRSLRGGRAMVIAALVGTVGFFLFNVALALFLAEGLGSTTLVAPVRYALSFLILGLGYSALGVGFAKRAERQMTGFQTGATGAAHEVDEARSWLAPQPGGQ